MRLIRMLAFLALFVRAAHAAPPPPSLVVARGTGLSQQVALTWTAVTSPSAVTGYYIYYDSIPTLTQSAGIYVTGTAYTVNGLPDRVPYWFWLASDEAGVGPGLTGTAVSAMAYQRPDPPLLTASALSFGKGFYAQWSQPTVYGAANAIGALRLEQVNGAAVSVLGSYAALPASATVAALPCGSPLTVQARVWDVFGTSSLASAATQLSVPCAPVAFSQSLGSGGLAVSWTASGAASFVVMSSTAAAGMDPLPSVAGLALSSTASWALPRPAQGQGLWTRVYAVDAQGVTSAGSNEVALLTPPSALSALPLKDGVRLQWSPSLFDSLQSVTAYQVYYATFASIGYGLSGVSTLLAPRSGLGLQALTLSALSAHQPYWAAVAAQGGSDSAQVGPIGPALQVLPGLRAPAFSQAQAVSFNALSFAWPVADLLGDTGATYTLYRSTDASLSPATALQSTTLTALSGVAPLAAGTPSWYFLGLTGSSGASSDLAAPDGGSAYLPSLAKPQPVIVGTGNGRARLAWPAVADADAYQVYRATDIAGTLQASLALSDGLTTGLSYTDVHPVNGVANVYRVEALRAPGTLFSDRSDMSDPLAVTPLAGVGMPGRYGSLNGADLAYLTVVAQAAQVDLFWTPAEQGSSALTGYQLYRGWSTASLSPIGGILGPGVTATSDSAPPQPIAGLVYALEAIDQFGNVARVTGTPGAFLAWPAPLSPVASVFTTAVRLSWASPSGTGTYPLADYQVSRRWQNGGPMTALAWVTGTAWTDTPLDRNQGSAPLYQIQARDSSGALGAALTISASLGAPAPSTATPGVVGGVSAAPLAQAGVPVQVTWTPNALFEGISGYLIYRNGLFVTETAASEYIDAAAGLGAWDLYQVQARNAAGLGVSGSAQACFVAPPQPAWVSVSASVDPLNDGTSTLRLRWQDQGAPTAVDSYSVYAQDNAFTGLGSATQIASGLVSPAFDYTAMSPTSQTAFVVLAVSGGQAAATPTAQLDLVVPALSGALNGLTGVPQPGGARLAWAASPNASEYWVYRSTQAIPALPAFPPMGRTTALVYSDGTAPSGQALNYGVATANSLGHGPVSTIAVTPQALAPTTLSAQPGFDGADAFVALSWSASTALSPTYQILRSVAGGAWAMIQSGVSSTVFTDIPLTGLTNTALSYSVQGVDLAPGGSIAAGPVRAYLPPAAPTALSASGADGAVDLRWSPSPVEQGVSAYALRFAVNGASLTWTAWAAQPTQSYRFTGLLPGTQLSAGLQALNSAGPSPWSVTVSAVANSAGAAPIPLTFVAAVGYPEAVTWQARVLLGWTASNAGAVLLYRSASPLAVSLAAGGEASPVFLTRLPGTQTSYLDVGIQGGLSYEYAVSALSSAGLPLGESVAVLSGPVTPYRQATPLSISGTAGDAEVDLQWGRPLDPGTYGAAALPFRLHRQTAPNAPAGFASVIDDAGFPLDLSSTSLVDRAVSNGNSYWYYLSQVDARGVETRDAAFPRTPDGLSHAGMRPSGPRRPPDPVIAVPGDQSVTLRWLATLDDANNGVVYNVYRRKDGEDFDGPRPDLFHVGASINEFAGGVNLVVLTLRDLSSSPSPPQNTQKYWYSISAINDAGEGPKSVEVGVTPFKALDPGSNTATGRTVSLLVVNKKNISLSWGPTLSQAGFGGYDLKEYRVYRSLDGGNTFTLSQTLPASLSQTAWTDTSTDYGRAYTYRIVPVDLMGNEGFSYEYKTVVIPAATDSVLVFRNSFDPALGERLPLQYAIQRPGHVWVKIFTLNGEYVATVFDEEVATASPDQPFLSELQTWDGRNSDGQLVASGVYLIHMEGPGYRSNARVAVIK